MKFFYRFLSLSAIDDAGTPLQLALCATVSMSMAETYYYEEILWWRLCCGLYAADYALFYTP